MEGLQRYQGEVMNKAKLQEAFQNKLANARVSGIGREEDWLEMRALLEALLGAFNSTTR